MHRSKAHYKDEKKYIFRGQITIIISFSRIDKDTISLIITRKNRQERVSKLYLKFGASYPARSSQTSKITGDNKRTLCSYHLM